MFNHTRRCYEDSLIPRRESCLNLWQGFNAQNPPSSILSTFTLAFAISFISHQIYLRNIICFIGSIDS
eukprot:CCRYP_017556-RA/>CCRYP_017556-RA protein AED:0.54 eAED:0.54 QI:0/0/0/0.5/0/0/2/0/67